MPDEESMTMLRTELTVSSLLLRVAELEDAIAPFARVAGWFEHQRPRHPIITTGIGDVTVDELLATRAVLAAGKWGAAASGNPSHGSAPDVLSVAAAGGAAFRGT